MYISSSKKQRAKGSGTKQKLNDKDQFVAKFYTLIVHTQLPLLVRETSRFVLGEPFPEKHCPALLHSGLNAFNTPFSPNANNPNDKKTVRFPNQGRIVPFRQSFPSCIVHPLMFLKEEKRKRELYPLWRLPLSHTHSESWVVASWTPRTQFFHMIPGPSMSIVSL